MKFVYLKLRCFLVTFKKHVQAVQARVSFIMSTNNNAGMD